MGLLAALVAWSLKNRAIVVVATLLLICVGVRVGKMKGGWMGLVC